MPLRVNQTNFNQVLNQVETSTPGEKTELTDKAVAQLWMAAKTRRPDGWQMKLAKTKLFRPLFTSLGKRFLKKLNRERCHMVHGVQDSMQILTESQQKGRAVLHDAFATKAGQNPHLVTQLIKIKENIEGHTQRITILVGQDILDPIFEKSLRESLEVLEQDSWQISFETGAFDGTADLLIALGLRDDDSMRQLQWEQRKADYLSGINDIPDKAPPGTWQEQVEGIFRDHFPNLPEDYFKDRNFAKTEASISSAFRTAAEDSTRLAEAPVAEAALEASEEQAAQSINVLDAARMGDDGQMQELTPDRRRALKERLEGVQEILAAARWSGAAIETGISNLVKVLGAKQLARRRAASKATIAEEYAAVALTLGKNQLPKRLGEFLTQWPDAARQAGLSQELTEGIKDAVVTNDFSAQIQNIKLLADTSKLLSKGAELDDAAILDGLRTLLETRQDVRYLINDQKTNALAASIVPPQQFFLEPQVVQETHRTDWERGLKPRFGDNATKASLRQAFITKIGPTVPYRKRVAGWEPSDALRQLYGKMEDFYVKHPSYSVDSILTAFETRIEEELATVNDSSPLAFEKHVISSLTAEQSLPLLYEELLRQELFSELPENLHAIVPDLLRKIGLKARTTPLNPMQLQFARNLASRLKEVAESEELSISELRARLSQMRDPRLMHADQVSTQSDAQARLVAIAQELLEPSSEISIVDLVQNIEAKPIAALGRIARCANGFLAPAGGADSPSKVLLEVIGADRGARQAIAQLIKDNIPEELKGRGKAARIQKGRPLVQLDLAAYTRDTIDELDKIANGEQQLLTSEPDLAALTAERRRAHEAITGLSTASFDSPGIPGFIYQLRADESLQGILHSPRRMKIAKKLLSPEGLAKLHRVFRFIRKPAIRIMRKILTRQVATLEEALKQADDTSDASTIKTQIALFKALNQPRALDALITVLSQWLQGASERHPRLPEHLDFLARLGPEIDPGVAARHLKGLYAELPQYSELINGLQAAVVDVD